MLQALLTLAILFSALMPQHVCTCSHHDESRDHQDHDPDCLVVMPLPDADCAPVSSVEHTAPILLWLASQDADLSLPWIPCGSVIEPPFRPPHVPISILNCTFQL